MANPKLRLGFREPEVDTNRPFVDGTVQVEGFDLEISDFHGPDAIDAWDASFGGLMRTKGKGEHPYVSIPAYPNRKFRLAYIFVNNTSGIETGTGRASKPLRRGPRTNSLVHAWT